MTCSDLIYPSFFYRKSYSEFPSQRVGGGYQQRYQKNGSFILEIISNNGKYIQELSEIGVFLESNRNFAIRVFTWGLANYLHISNYEKAAKHIILSNFI